MLSTAAFTFPALASSRKPWLRKNCLQSLIGFPFQTSTNRHFCFVNAAGQTRRVSPEWHSLNRSRIHLRRVYCFLKFLNSGTPSFLGRHAASYNFSLSTCANNSPLYRQILNPLSTFNLGATVDVNNLLPHGDHSAVTEHAARQLPISLNFPSNKR